MSKHISDVRRQFSWRIDLDPGTSGCLKASKENFRCKWSDELQAQSPEFALWCSRVGMTRILGTQFGSGYLSIHGIVRDVD
jgi:hypothetical protein